jgi:hypothetical protein
MVVPMVGLPPLFGRKNDHAMQANAALGVAIELRRRAPEIAEQGSAEITRTEWERVADGAGYSRRYIGRTVEHILENFTKPGGQNGAPALLERTDPWRFNFGPEHEAARRALLEAGRRTIRGQADGERSAERRVSTAPQRRYRQK